MPVDTHIINGDEIVGVENSHLLTKNTDLNNRRAPAQWTNKFGYNGDVDTGAAGEDIWNQGGVWAAPTTHRQHNIVSTSVADVGSSTGAHTINVVGLNHQGREIEEEVLLNGQTDVLTENFYQRIYRMYVILAGSGGANAGIITATAVTDGTVTASISIGDNQTLIAIYTVPANKRGLMNILNVSIDPSNNTTVTMNLMSRKKGEVWRVKSRFILTNVYPSHTIIFNPPKRFTAMEDIKVHAVTSANNIAIAAGFDVQLDDID